MKEMKKVQRNPLSKGPNMQGELDRIRTNTSTGPDALIDSFMPMTFKKNEFAMPPRNKKNEDHHSKDVIVVTSRQRGKQV